MTCFGGSWSDYNSTKAENEEQKEEKVECVVAIFLLLCYHHFLKDVNTLKIQDKIYRLRTENNLTQNKFGEIAGVSGKAVSTWENGVKEARMKAVQKICVHFDIPINLFVDEESDVYSYETAVCTQKKSPDDRKGLRYSSEAMEIAEKYDRLDAHGKKMVRLVAEEETARMKEAAGKAH